MYQSIKQSIEPKQSSSSLSSSSSSSSSSFPSSSSPVSSSSSLSSSASAVVVCHRAPRCRGLLCLRRCRRCCCRRFRARRRRGLCRRVWGLCSRGSPVYRSYTKPFPLLFNGRALTKVVCGGLSFEHDFCSAHGRGRGAADMCACQVEQQKTILCCRP